MSLTDAELTDELARLLARRRCNGQAYMDGRHNPLPSERQAAERFVSDYIAPLVAALRAEREETGRLRDVAMAARKVRRHHPYCESLAIGDHPCDCDEGAVMRALARLDGGA